MSTKRMLVAVAVAGVIAAGGGSAFTASNTIAASTAGFGQSTITGATATSVVYALGTDGTKITGATIKFTGDLSTNKVQAGFGETAPTDCGTGVHSSGVTTFTCTGFDQSTQDAEKFSVAVG